MLIALLASCLVSGSVGYMFASIMRALNELASDVVKIRKLQLEQEYRALGLPAPANREPGEHAGASRADHT